MNPGRCDDLGCHDSFGAATPDVGAKAPPNQNYGECPKSVALMGLFANAGLGPVWLNYCLKGAQVAFTDKGRKADPARQFRHRPHQRPCRAVAILLRDLPCARRVQQRG